MSFGSFTKFSYLRTSIIFATILAVHTYLLLFAAIRLIQSSSHATVRQERLPQRSPPELFIFRRSKKTGSTSMAVALLKALQPYGYVTPQVDRFMLAPFIRNAFIRNERRRFMIMYHNDITKAHHPSRDAVIADTFREGLSQVTSYCNRFQHVETCDSAMVACMQRANRAINSYRHHSTDGIEQDESYIDMPLSVEYPFLSNAVMKTVFPDIELEIGAYNVRESACNETMLLREAYTKHYSVLEKQIQELQTRMLVITGYPATPILKPDGSQYSLKDMLDAAEKMESKKSGHIEPRISHGNDLFKKKLPDIYVSYRQARKQWYVRSNGDLIALSTNEKKNLAEKVTNAMPI